MNIAPAHLDALKALGYTEAETRFLYIVATHSGYFTARQFLAFTGGSLGQADHDLLEQAKPKDMPEWSAFQRAAWSITSSRGGSTARSKRENLRNRREHEFDFIKRRIAILDFVLLNEGYHYLETEPEKVRFFCGTLNIQKHYLPARLYLGSKTSSTSIRHFVDKFPMFFVAPSPVVTFTYIHEGAAAFTDFVRHLESYLPLFRQLFRVPAGLCIPYRFALREGHGNLFFPREDSTRIRHRRRSASLLPRAQSLGQKQYGTVSDADLIFRNHARARFTGERFEGLYRGWKNGRVSEIGIRQEVGTNDSKHSVGFDTFLLQRIGPVVDSADTE